MTPERTVRTHLPDVNIHANGHNEHSLARLGEPSDGIEDEGADAIAESDERVVDFQIVATAFQRKKSDNVFRYRDGWQSRHFAHHANPLAKETASRTGEPLGFPRKGKILAGERTPG